MHDFLIQIEKISGSISAMILLTAAIIAYFSLVNAEKVARNTRLMHLYTHIADHNESMRKTEYLKIAINIFLDLENDQAKYVRLNIEKENTGYFNLYWAARSAHMSHVNLVFQVWNFSNCDENRFRSEFPEWVTFGKIVSDELTFKNKKILEKPQWYLAACHDIGKNMRQNGILTDKFIDFFMYLE